MLVEYSDNKIEITATFFKLESWLLCSTWDSSEAGWSRALFCWLHKPNRNVPVRGCKRVGTSLGAQPARTLITAFLPCNTSESLAPPIRRLPYKNVCVVVVWKQHFPSLMELCQSHCGQEVRNGTPTLILHLAAQASPSLANPWDGRVAAQSHCQWGLRDTWDLSWPLEQPQMCCILAYALCTCRLVPHS